MSLDAADRALRCGSYDRHRLTEQKKTSVTVIRLAVGVRLSAPANSLKLHAMKPNYAGRRDEGERDRVSHLTVC
jgi:hypothetical protein